MRRAVELLGLNPVPSRVTFAARVKVQSIFNCAGACEFTGAGTMNLPLRSLGLADFAAGEI